MFDEDIESHCQEIEACIRDQEMVQAALRLIDLANDLEEWEPTRRNPSRDEAVIICANIKSVEDGYRQGTIDIDKYLKLRTPIANQILVLKYEIVSNWARRSRKQLP